ncbi:MAG: hypothetical protein NVSMB47_22070 [Polyangiales bacterium]
MEITPFGKSAAGISCENSSEPGTDRREIHRLGKGAAGTLCENSRGKDGTGFPVTS